MKYSPSMKQVSILIACFVFALMICACGNNKSQSGGVQTAANDTAANGAAEDMGGLAAAEDLNDEASSNGTDDGWKAAYAEFIKTLMAQDDEYLKPNVIQFALVDEDDIPEMAVYFTKDGTSYTFCTYSDGQVKVLGEDVPYYITLNIVSKENRFVYTFSKGRTREDALGSISSGAIKVEPFGTVDRKDDTATYFWQEAEVSEEEYLQNVSALLEGADADTTVGMARHDEDVDNTQFFTVDGALAYLA